MRQPCVGRAIMDIVVWLRSLGLEQRPPSARTKLTRPSEAAVVSQTSSSSIEPISWLLRVITALSGAAVIGSITWFLIAPSAPGWTKRTFWQ